MDTLDLSPRQEIQRITLTGAEDEGTIISLIDPAFPTKTIAADSANFLDALAGVIEAYSPRTIVDETLGAGNNVTRAFEYLFPVLVSGGTYTIILNKHREQEGVKQLCGLASAAISAPDELDETLISEGSAAIFKEWLVSMTVSGTKAVFRKSAQKFSVLTEAPLAALADAAGSDLFTSPAVTYPLIRPVFMNHDDKPSRLSGFTDDFSPRTTPTVYGTILDDAVVFGGGVVSVAQRYVVTESLIYLINKYVRHSLYRIGESSTYLVKLELANARTTKPELHVLARQAWDRNYGHWLVDAFGRMAFLKHVLPPEENPYYVVSGHGNKQLAALYEDTLSLFGVPNSRVTTGSSHPIHYSRLLYISPATAGPLNHHPKIIELLDSFATHPPQATDRIYVSRGHYSRRRVTNEEELLPILAKHGFRVIFPEELPLEGQIDAFARAGVVAGPFGAALTSLAFSPPGVSAVCMTADSSWAGYFYDLVAHKQGTWFNIYPPETEGLTNASDIYIEPELFEESLKLAIAAREEWVAQH